MIFVFLCQTSLNRIISWSIHVAINTIVLLSLWLSNTHTHISSLYIHLSMNEHLGCFHVLTIVNSAAVNIEVHVSFKSAYSGYLPRRGL